MGFKRWFMQSVQHSHTGRLSAFDVCEAYNMQSDLYDSFIEYGDALSALSSRFEMRQDEFTGEMLACAVIQETEQDEID